MSSAEYDELRMLATGLNKAVTELRRQMFRHFKAEGEIEPPVELAEFCEIEVLQLKTERLSRHLFR